ncbi:WYL domain-containing protein [Photobacterium sp. J15]|uniref:WYL domain-containing protein n=1 Tax=Photobacterium sp. J15 TaxID=265901 RepID=UPI0009FC9FBE|nr:WYL domain-containing protein [Photobacterium sp. J15]
MLNYDELKTEHKNNADRFAYIDFMLRFTGTVRRSEIGTQFNLSDAAASKVLKAYNDVCPNNMRYDHSIRANSLSPDYEPLLEWGAEVALGMLANGFNKNKLSEPARTVIPYEKITSLPDQMKTETVAAITRAISGGYSVHCEYYSKSGKGLSDRELVPLEILNDGEFWMFRAYDRSENSSSRSKFKFFNFARVLSLAENSYESTSKRKEHENIKYDVDWNLEIPLDLKLHEDRCEKEREEIRIDFGLSSGVDQLFILKRAAFLWILKNKWSIDTRTTEQIATENKRLEKVNKQLGENYISNNKKDYKFRLCNLEMIEMLLEQNNSYIKLR